VFFAKKFEGLLFHFVEIFLCGRNVIATLFSFIQQHFQAPIEMFVERQRFAALKAFKQRNLGFEQLCNKGIPVCVATGIDLLVKALRKLFNESGTLIFISPQQTSISFPSYEAGETPVTIR